MGMYHFVRDCSELKAEQVQLPRDRITVTYRGEKYEKFGDFYRSEHFSDSRRDMIVGNCEGSLMVIDSAIDVSENPLNKLHIGELVMRTPHVESFEQGGLKGIRADLACFDIQYAGQMLDELTLWRDSSYREGRLKEYETERKPNGEPRWYCVPHRIAQLKISPLGLEKKIEEIQRVIEGLGRPDARETREFISEENKKIEANCYEMIKLMGARVHSMDRLLNEKREAGKLTKREQQKPKVMTSKDIFALAEKVYSDLKDVLNFVRKKVDIRAASNYWQTVAEWERL